MFEVSQTNIVNIRHNLGKLKILIVSSILLLLNYILNVVILLYIYLFVHKYTESLLDKYVFGMTGIYSTYFIHNDL